MTETPISDEQRYRLIIEGVSDYALYMLDPTGIVSSWNPGAQRFKGYTRGEIIGQHFSRFYTEEDRASGLPGRALSTAENEGRFEHEGWRVRKDGSRFWAHVIIDPIRSPSGTLLGFAKITRDISQRKAAQDELRRSEERFRLLVQGVTDYAIFMLDPEGRVTNWNAGAHRIKGYTETEIVGEHFSRFYADEDRQSGLPARALQTAATKGRFEQEGWRVRKGGSRFWAHVVIDAIRDEGDVLLGYAKVTRDITERRDAQQALEETRAKLLQSQKMEAVGQLTGGVAHDFNNLLAVVVGSLDLLRKRVPDDPKIAQLIDNAAEAAKRGAALTQRMLAFARRQELRTEPVDVPELVRNMADLLQRSIGPTARIDTQFPLGIAPALVDGSQLELALLNLVLNARDAMPNGGRIIIAAREGGVETDRPNGLEPGKYICFSVADTGEGMDEATLARAVEPFFTTKGVGRGTGLGLSMIHGFAEQSRGRLVLRSTKGEGTTAELWLPIALVDGAAALDAEEQTTRLERTPNCLTVLVVDDDALVLMNTAAMLEDLGHEVIEATSGEHALRVLRRGAKVDVVVTDQLMPGMLGTQLLDAVRAEWPDLPCILATGYAELPLGTGPELRRLSKPFMQSELGRAVAMSVPSKKDEQRVVPFRPKQG